MANNPENWTNFKYFSADPNQPLETISSPILDSILPICGLHGTQRLEEYSRAKEERVKRLLAQQGINFLIEFPIIACAVPNSSYTPYLEPDSIRTHTNYSLVILDGHHRARYAPIYGINEIPGLVLTVEQAANAYKISEIDKFLEIIDNWVGAALDSFSRKNPYMKPPGEVRFYDVNGRILTRLVR